MNLACIDTNVIIRFLVENPQTINLKFKGVFAFFTKLEQGNLKAYLPDIVLFQAYFVLTSYYKVPGSIAAEKLENIAKFRGISMLEKNIAVECLKIVRGETIDIVDAYLLAHAKEKRIPGVYSFDHDLERRGLPLLAVE